MFAPPVMQVLTGDRLHLSHGPIDVVLRAWGEADDVRAAYAAAWARFQNILPELCDELRLLRMPMDELIRRDATCAENGAVRAVIILNTSAPTGSRKRHSAEPPLAPALRPLKRGEGAVAACPDVIDRLTRTTCPPPAGGEGLGVGGTTTAGVLRSPPPCPSPTRGEGTIAAEVTYEALFPLQGAVARRMFAACVPFADVFVTPMASVAGAVADELMAHMAAAAPITRAYVNDGGDIAVRVPEGQALEIGLAGDFALGDVPALNGRLRLTGASGIGGIATSGARGRSFSLGIADSVTILARDAATADVAATLVANAVDVNSGAVGRRPARELDPDSDLGDRLVTVSVGTLTAEEIAAALERGLARARIYRGRGLIADAALMLAGHTSVIGLHQLTTPADADADGKLLVRTQ